MKREPNKSMRLRTYFVLAIIMLVFVVILVIHLFKVSIIEHSKYEKLANDYHFGTISIEADRGAIYDSNGTPLAWSATVYKVYIDPELYREEMQDIVDTNNKLLSQKGSALTAEDGYVDVNKVQDELITFLATELEIEENDVISAMAKESRYCVLQTQVEKPVADEILEYADNLGLSCIATVADTKRYYPQNELAAAVIGFTNGDGDGQYGIESYYNDYLSGTDGRVVSAKDANGNEMPYRNSQTYDAENGDSLYLTIDINMQYYLEKNLADMCDEFDVAERACGIIMNAKTGAIYAMATVPGFDLNNPSVIYDSDTADELKSLTGDEYDTAYAEARELQWKNKAVTETYIPGSVFKVFTGSAALEEQVIDTDTFSYSCSGSIHVVDADLYCSHLAGHGTQTFQQAMTNSCNPAFVQIGLDLGIGLFSQYFRAFGLDSRTGIDLPGEAGSIYYSESTMGVVELGSTAFGQSSKITPIQMITGYAAAINGGYLVTPYVVGEIKDSDGNTVEKTTTTVKRQVISEETSAKMREVLENVVEDAPNSNSYISGYKIGGKTGTSQKNDLYNIDDESSMQYVASYCCFAPADDPEIIMLILADEPDKNVGYYGSQVVVPYATKVLEEILPYLGYYPEYSDSDYSSLVSEVPSVADMSLSDAQETLTDANLTYTIIGDGDTVVKQSPSSGYTVIRGGNVVIYTEDTDYQTTTMPSVVGYSLTAAQTLLYENGLNVVISSSSDADELVVTSQSYETGTEVYTGTVVTITLGSATSVDDEDDDGGANQAYNDNFVED
jgi:stage V sporulation protein D (sporulation-specific penicillin-binding protein)